MSLLQKNEGYKTIISIRGVGNETNQNAIAAPSVAFHMDGVFIASPFALGTDFLDVERIEVLTSGASSIYGSDAVAGVVNVILVDGLERQTARVVAGGGVNAGSGGETLNLEFSRWRIW